MSARPAALSRRLPLWAVLALVAVVAGLFWWAGRSGGPATDGSSRPAALPSVSAPGSAPTPDSGLATIAESALPSQARHTLDLIRTGGPYPYAKDGATFLNRERLLPRQSTGYYREFTVRKPGESDRGPWRIIAGHAGDRYWTADHYAHFQQIEEGR